MIIFLALITAGMFAIIWFGADRSQRKQQLLPPSYMGIPMSSKPNPYMGKMCAIGAVLALPIGLIAGLIAWLATILR